MRVRVLHLGLAAIVLALATVSVTGCAGEEDGHAQGDRARAASPLPHSVTLPRGVGARLPAGWQLLRKPITGVVYPVQVFAAASYPVAIGKQPPGCHPGRALDRRPAEGVLVQVIEWTEHHDQPRPEGFPPRQRPFRLPKRTYATHECAGPSYNVAFRDAGRAFQAFVRLDQGGVDARARRQAVDLLGSLRFRGGRSGGR